MMDIMGTANGKSTGIVWIAGVGAHAGLGAAVARRFARGSRKVVVTGRTSERLEAVAESIRRAGGDAVALAGDISRESEVVSLAAKVAEIGPLEVAVFNAAASVRAPSLALSADSLESSLRTTVVGGFVFGRAAIRQLLPHKRGSMLFTGATASLRGRPPFVAFAAAKAALRSISQTFAREFGPSGIHVAHVIIDGGIDGERLRTGNPERYAQQGSDGLLNPDKIAEVYWQLHAQPKSTWTQELDVRPYKESF
jgi:NAD(P)-dependent dehydrogenase (short-subunit alcohol dehydrogenase family)